MDRPGDYHTKGKGRRRKTSIICHHLCEQCKKNYTNELTYKTKIESQTENKRMFTKRESGWWRYKLVG